MTVPWSSAMGNPHKMGYAGYLDHINGLMTIPQYGYQWDTQHNKKQL